MCFRDATVLPALCVLHTDPHTRLFARKCSICILCQLSSAQMVQLRLAVPIQTPLSPSPGEYSYLGTTLRRVSIEPMPSLLDVRQLITLYGILPLGKTPHAHLPALTVSSWLSATCTGAYLFLPSSEWG